MKLVLVWLCDIVQADVQVQPSRVVQITIYEMTIFHKCIPLYEVVGVLFSRVEIQFTIAPEPQFTVQEICNLTSKIGPINGLEPIFSKIKKSQK